VINAPIDPNDNNACTDDSCDPATGVINAPIDPNDNNACTDDSCDPATGVVNAPVDPDDGNACTEDSCDPATGVANTPVDPDDGNACTEDSCDPATGVANTPVDPDDGNACTDDSCDPATGVVNTPVDPDDGVACTDDSCDPGTGIVNTPNDGLCDNEQFCDGTESCDETLGCVSNNDAPVVPDSVSCTDDSCDEVNDVIVHAPNDALCDNEQFCDGTESCDETLGCVSNNDAPVVPDSVSCTDDYCDEINDVIVHEANDDNCDQTSNACTDPDTCDPVNDCQPNNKACGSVTDSQLCEFNRDPTKGICVDAYGVATGETCDPTDGGTACTTGTCEDDGDFRLLFIPDVQQLPFYKLVASNPGQTYYNVFHDGTKGESVTLTIDIPWPYVTVGGNPVHVYDGNTVPLDADGCFLDDSATEVPASWTSNCGEMNWSCPAQDGSACQITVEFVMPSDLAYVNVHLDYGLEGPQTDCNIIDSVVDRYDRDPSTSDAMSVDLVSTTDTSNPMYYGNPITQCTAYEFSYNGDSGFDVVQNGNVYKPLSGAMARAFSSEADDPVPEGALAELVNARTGEVVASDLSDEDGYIRMVYAHKGKPTDYIVRLPEYGLEQIAQFRSNGWTYVTFDVFTGSTTAVTGCGGSDGCSSGGGKKR
jgi:hypothetical protein